MDSFRLLTRSTGLRAQPTKTNSQNLPSEGQRRRAQDDHSNAGQKRKREHSQDENGHHLPSDDSGLSEEQCRKIQNERKIKIVDLRRLYRERLSEIRTGQKEAARIFPEPLLQFSSLKSRFQIGHNLAENVADQGYFEPTDVQMATLPVLLDRAFADPDLLTIAPTGSGKTLAYLIPLIEKLRTNRQQTKDRTPKHTAAVILAPTKELVFQIVNEGRKLCARTGVNIAAMRRGMVLDQTASPQIGQNGIEDDVEHPQNVVKADILVTTPLLLFNSLQNDGSSDRISLRTVQTLVLDEADVLLDPLFRDQTRAVWSACTSPELRTSFWSATIGSNIEELVVSIIDERQQELDIRGPQPLLRTVIGLKDSSLPTITHKLVYAASEPGKLLALRQLLHPARSSAHTDSMSRTSNDSALRPPFLIFTQTIERATALYGELLYDIPAVAGGSSRIAALHSSLSDSKRSDIMTRFRKGQVWVLITTDLLSRGVDFRGINGVVNYDIPTTAASYVHRAGRTGRAGRLGGICVTFYTKDDIQYVKTIANVIATSQSRKSKDGGENTSSGLESWVLQSLPEISKKDRKELKERGVPTRRAIKESDDVKERRMKRKAKIGTKSGYEKKRENNLQGAVKASQRKIIHSSDIKNFDEVSDEDWSGLSN